MRRLVFAFLTTFVFAAAARADEHSHWIYGQGHGGPTEWGELSPEFRACGLGHLQSPIDIRGAQKAALPEIRFAYQAGGPTVVNNGHTIQVTPPAGSTISVGDHTYRLLQFHFHAPSEEAVQGVRSPLVAHFVHQDAGGKLAVVAVLFDVGAENPALAPVFARMPANAPGDVALAGVQLDPAAVLPATRGYYEYEGSLTTPPCSEGVHWFVLRGRATLSQAQLDAFRKLYPNNARPLQPLNGRVIRASM